MLDFIQGLFKAAREYFERQDDALWREFLEDVEAAYERDQNHTFLIQVFEASLTDESVRRRIVEKIFTNKEINTSKMINGLILAGGKSSRMHYYKELIVYHGKPQHEYLTDLLHLFCQDVFISRSKDQTTPLKNSIPDHFDLNSPLNGILSAFHFDPDATWITVPIDMPNIDKKVIEYLIKKRDTHKVATCFTDSDGEQPEPLITIWETKAKPILFDFFNSGGYSAKKFLQENDVNIIRCPHPEWLVNINTEEELKKYQKK